MNLRNLSGETLQLLNEGVGWRTENFSGEGIRDIQRVVDFETLELLNVDIPETMLHLYSSLLTREEAELVSLYTLVQDPEVDWEELAFRKRQQFLDTVFNLAIRVTGNPTPHCIWLADMDTVQAYYLQGEEGDIDGYAIPDNACVLADLGYDGALFAF